MSYFKLNQINDVIIDKSVQKKVINNDVFSFLNRSYITKEYLTNIVITYKRRGQLTWLGLIVVLLLESNF